MGNYFSQELALIALYFHKFSLPLPKIDRINIMPDNTLQNINIKNKIHVIRGQQVMLDRDLAKLYLTRNELESEKVANCDLKQRSWIKDLGKKCFAFEILDSALIMENL